MATITREIKLSGICLMSGKEANVTLCPSDSGKISFYPDKSDVRIDATLENVISTVNCTVLGIDGRQIRLVEHFMAACALAEIDSLNVYVDSSELPIFDGSAKVWYEEFQKAGVSRSPKQSIEFEQPYFLSEGHTSIVLLPSDSFKITYLINFDHPELSNRWITHDFKNNSVEIIEARTFGYLNDLEKFQNAGFALGANTDNTVGLTDDSYTVELRSKFEPVKHKILDLVGDLMLSGVNPLDYKAHIIAKEAGHRTHIEFAHIIKNKFVVR